MLVFALSSYGFSRDIDLDALYIKQSSKSHERLIQQKLEIYAVLGSSEIDSGVIFAGWISGDEIVYVREMPDSAQNAIILYTISTAKKTEISRLKGSVTAARCATGGFIVLKRLVTGKGGMPVSEMAVVDVKSGKTTYSPAEFPFLDFDIPLEGNSFLVETKRGIEEYSPGTGQRKVVVDKARYGELSTGTGPVIPLLSPDRAALLLLSGGGGEYDGLVIRDGKKIRLRGITSASEVAWIGPRALAYRTGSAGNYSVVIQTLEGAAPVTVLEKSMNTNLVYSPHAGILSMQTDGLACIYYPAEKRLLQLGIEGEDMSFDPIGSRLVSLSRKRLFLTPLQHVQKRQIELARAWEALRASYAKIRERREDFANDYSLDYITRKMNAYSALLNGSK